jgi:lipoic acid synthetase
MLAYAKSARPGIPTKSGLMLGLGETIDEVLAVMADLRKSNVDILTLGQYLRPSPKHLPIVRYVAPEEFAELKRRGFEMGFQHVESGPLVRSSYHAADAVA